MLFQLNYVYLRRGSEFIPAIAIMFSFLIETKLISCHPYRSYHSMPIKSINFLLPLPQFCSILLKKGKRQITGKKYQHKDVLSVKEGFTLFFAPKIKILKR